MNIEEQLKACIENVTVMQKEVDKLQVLCESISLRMSQIEKELQINNKGKDNGTM
jgi:hypothetical protein